MPIQGVLSSSIDYSTKAYKASSALADNPIKVAGKSTNVPATYYRTNHLYLKANTFQTQFFPFTLFFL